MKFRRVVVVLAVAAIPLAVATFLCATGRWIPNEPSSARHPVRGIDVSHHQNEINWPVVSSTGIRFAYIKATEGGDYYDPRFKENWEGAAKAGIPRGAYHFFTIATSGKMQAAYFILKVPDDPVALPPMIDLELSGINKSVDDVPAFQRELADFISAITAYYGRQPVLYTTWDFKENYLQGMTGQPWWIREVITSPGTVEGEPWTIWQYTGRGHLPGITGYIDLNVFNGTQQDFEAFARKKK